MKHSEAADKSVKLVKAVKLICELQKIVGLTNDRKALADLCEESWKPFAIDEYRDAIYKTIWKDGVRTIQGILERCEAIMKILTRPRLNVEMRLAACWFQVNDIDANTIEGNAQSVMANSLSCTESEYYLDGLEKVIPKESVAAFKAVWDCYKEFCTIIAKGIEEVFDYPRAVRFYMQYFAIIRRDEVDEVIHVLQSDKPFTREYAFKLFLGEEISSNHMNSEWDLFEIHMKRLNSNGNVQC